MIMLYLIIYVVWVISAWITIDEILVKCKQDRLYKQHYFDILMLVLIGCGVVLLIIMDWVNYNEITINQGDENE